MTRTKTTTTDTTKPETQAANPPVTFNLEDPALQAIIAQAVAAALAAQKAEAVTAKGERSIQNEIAVVRAFSKAGFGKVVPHEDVRTFNRWISAGFRPVEGSKSLKIKNLRLFHKSQVRQLSAEERQAMQAQSDAAVARHTAKVIPMTEANPQ